jgi:hypothetical protein
MDTEKIRNPIKWTHILRWYIIDISAKVYKIDEDFFSRTNYGGIVYNPENPANSEHPGSDNCIIVWN